MPRRHLILTDAFPYHVMNRSNNKEFFYIEKKLWEIFADKLTYLVNAWKCNIHCFVLMNNHYHLILDTPKMNIGECMRYLHSEVARSSNRYARRENHFFGGRYKWSLINEELYYWNAIKYVYRNPVKAMLINEVQNYRYSTLNTKLPFEQSHFFKKHRVLADKLCLEWLNEPFLKEQEEAIVKRLEEKSI